MKNEKKEIVYTSIFDAIKQNPKYEQKRSADWFRKKIIELETTMKIKTDQAGLMKTTRDHQSTKILPGTLVFFSYDPKYKEKLPYYDMFPLSFIIGIDKGHMTGINFHYLAIPVRIKLYDMMYKIASMTHLPTQQVLALNWKLLSNISKFPMVVPAIKKYRFDHIRSRFIKIDIEDWKTAIMLENAQFKKQSAGTVRNISTRIAADAINK